MPQPDTLDGTPVQRGDSHYEQARLGAVWNARKPDRYPDAILLAGSDDDGGLLIDLSRLRDVRVDPAARRAWVRPAVPGPEIDRLLAEHGLYFPAGPAPTVGIGGFILGGGYGWNSRTFGPAWLSIRAIDVVLPNGEFVHATTSTTLTCCGRRAAAARASSAW